MRKHQETDLYQFYIINYSLLFNVIIKYAIELLRSLQDPKIG